MNPNWLAMAGTLGVRLARMVAVVLLIAVFNFLLVRAAPGDPALVIAGQSGATDQAFLDRVRAEYGLDQPIASQLTTYLGKVARLDLGFSYRQQRPVLDVILERMPATLLLTGTAFLISLLGGIVLGSLAGVRAGKLSDTLITIVSLVVYATPVFWLGLMLVLLFSVQLGWLPAFGFGTIGSGLTGAAAVLDKVQYLVLPAITLGMLYLAIYARLMRASIIEVSHQDYVKTARAKGASESRVLWHHMLRNALLPVVTMAGMQAGTLIGGSVVIETVFAWPGLGRLTYEAVLQRDYQVMLGVFLVLSVIVIFFNWLTDLLYRVIDPRIAR
ncbi:Glutathione transport system permease protein GsiC [Variovorax sp. PBS-H4]|uniref:ABC transporter permease n=1 Tax=Variovorax sp. PBS-H4 TaxID=434008 RepID=UPI001318E1BE|nr:ABC transporter permease [Variovorax sp. PBS-H4]VTU37530.1 Glutathione transport system permease protein GsiC [Variovorax sp. PBS-H4]